MIDVPLKVEISDYSLGSPVVKISISLQASEVREVVEESALQARGEHTHHLSRNVKASDLELVQHFPTTTSSLGRSTDQLMPSLAFKVSGIIIISTKSYIWVQNCFSFFSKQISFFFFLNNRKLLQNRIHSYQSQQNSDKVMHPNFGYALIVFQCDIKSPHLYLCSYDF